jgi:putative chitinase
MMETYQIHTCLRKAHALAQLGHESGHLKYRAEVLPPNKTEEVQYSGYMGRGLIQLTGKENYAAYGRFKNADFLGENRLKLESHEYATDSAGWFWNYGRSCGLSDYADKNDLIFLSAEINGGFNGFQDRVSIFQRAHAILNADQCKDERHRSAVYLPFERSKAYDNRDLAFAWGLWSDPGTKRHGLAKNAAASVAGYRRFLELNELTPIKRRRFGFESTDALIQYAKEKTS